jgi:hypothetical protein
MHISYLRVDDHVAIQTSFWESKDGNDNKARIDEARRIKAGSLDDWEEITDDLWNEMDFVGSVSNFGLIGQEPIKGLGMVYYNATPEYFADELNYKPATIPSFEPIKTLDVEAVFTLEADRFFVTKQLVVDGKIIAGFEAAQGYVEEVSFDIDTNIGYIYNVSTFDLNRGIKTAMKFTIDPITRNIYVVDCEHPSWMSLVNNIADFTRNPLNVEIHHLLYQDSNDRSYRGSSIWVTSRRFHYLRLEDGNWQLFHNPQSLERAITTDIQRNEWIMYESINAIDE